ncbi:MAG: FAD:protein FMN transferase [Phycisphaerales bacterium]|nr:FAD:protein FMN transferase [Phycisphaerales bacterium]
MTPFSHNADAGGGEPITLARDAMGTRFELLIAPCPGGLPRAALLAAAGEALEEIERLHRLLSPFEPASQVAAINRSAGSGHSVRVDLDVYDLLDLAKRVWSESGGAFDCTVGPLMRALGFRGEPRGAVPEPRRDMAGVDLARDPARVALPPGVELDLGAIAKGWALDQSARILREAGVSAALLHGGTSSVCAIGAPPGAPAWRVGLRVPGTPSGGVSSVAVLRDLSLGVSAPHGRHNDLGQGHVLDPRARASVPSGGFAACVSPSGALADAWSTAALVLGARGESAASTRFDVTTYLVSAVDVPPTVCGPRADVFVLPGVPGAPERTD